MRQPRQHFHFLFVALFLCFAFVVPQPVNAADAPYSFADLADRLLPSVVNISSTQKMQSAPNTMHEMPPMFPPGSPFEDFFEEFMDRPMQGAPAVPPASLGSGFIIDAEKGYIVTNNHVIRDAEEVRVTFFDDETIEAEIIGRDEKTDLAILKVDTDKKLTAVKFGDSDTLRVGDWALAIGNPFGLGGTVTAGIVSAQQRNIHAGPYDDFIQTDASINRGNSGGPMFNIDGEVIGINTAIFSPSGGSVGIGFAIPVNLAKPVIDQLIEYGHTRRGWLGVRIQSVTPEIAESLGLDKDVGALVASVTSTGPAEDAGLKTGDIILSFDGKAIDKMRDLPRIVAETKVGKSVDIVYWRDSKKHTTQVEIGELEKAEETGLLASTGGPDGTSDKPAGTMIEKIGATIQPITDADRDIYAIPDDVNGVLITGVSPTSEAAEKGLSQGDVISEINQKPVSSVEDILNNIKMAEDAGRSSVLLLVHREDDVRFVALRLK